MSRSNMLKTCVSLSKANSSFIVDGLMGVYIFSTMKAYGGVEYI